MVRKTEKLVFWELLKLWWYFTSRLWAWKCHDNNYSMIKIIHYWLFNHGSRRLHLRKILFSQHILKVFFLNILLGVADVFELGSIVVVVCKNNKVFFPPPCEYLHKNPFKRWAKWPPEQSDAVGLSPSVSLGSVKALLAESDHNTVCSFYLFIFF